MGSQSVTNFSEVRKKRIQRGILDFEPDAPDATLRARQAGVAAIGSFAPTSSFFQALTSASAETAARTLSDLVVELKTTRSRVRVEEILARYGVGAGETRPYAPLVAGLRRELEERLTATSNKTEAAPSAADAIGATVLDVIKARFPDRREPADISSAELVDAIRKTPPGRFTTLYVTNLISSLLRQTFDAARETEVPRQQVDALVERIGPALARDLARDLARVDVKPQSIREKLKGIKES